MAGIALWIQMPSLSGDIESTQFVVIRGDGGVGQLGRQRRKLVGWYGRNAIVFMSTDIFFFSVFTGTFRCMSCFAYVCHRQGKVDALNNSCDEDESSSNGMDDDNALLKDDSSDRSFE